MFSIATLSKQELTTIIQQNSSNPDPAILAQARHVCNEHYGNKVFLRGLIEISNYCKNDCYYCGIRKSNHHVVRYHLDKEQILSCCAIGYQLGFRTFVLQGGEDGSFDDKTACDVVFSIRSLYPDCAITLSLGERNRENYTALYRAGADRFLLRHETASADHYQKLHPSSLTFEHRKKCLYTLKDIGFQVGAGFMVGSPYQTAENLAKDLMFLRELQPHMVGVGPFIPHNQTPFAHFSQGGLQQTLLMVALVRLLLPKALIPSTTALGTINPQGRLMGLRAGANVVMPNLSPANQKDNYSLYNNKANAGDQAQEYKKLFATLGDSEFVFDYTRGDHVNWSKL